MSQAGKKPPITETAPKDWSSEKEIIAKDALRVLMKHYPKVRWGIEFPDTYNGAIGAMIVRMTDYPTKTVYVINAKDIDRDRMTCVIKAGGVLLEAHGLSRNGRNLADDFRGLKQTPAGLIVPDYGAVPETNPGYEAIKKDYGKLHDT